MPSRGVCPSVRHVRVLCGKETSNHILKLFSPSGSHTILVFPYQKLRQHSENGDPLMGAASNAGAA